MSGEEDEAGSGGEQGGALEVSRLGKMCTGPGPAGKRPQVKEPVRESWVCLARVVTWSLRAVRGSVEADGGGNPEQEAACHPLPP